MRYKILIILAVIAFSCVSFTTAPRYEVKKRRPQIGIGLGDSRRHRVGARAQTPILVSHPCAQHGAVRLFHVKYVYDGDTILIDNNEKVRYLGIDAPEIGHHGEISEFMAIQSRVYNLRLVGHGKIRLEFGQNHRDQYGRFLAFVYIESGEMVNGLLVKHGLAHVMVESPKQNHFELLLEYQRQAMTNRLGIWSNSPVMPEPHYIGNRASYRFHRSACPFGRKIFPKNRIHFATYDAAYWEGFSPCEKCRP